jgi:hypothetical protein
VAEGFNLQGQQDPFNRVPAGLPSLVDAALKAKRYSFCREAILPTLIPYFANLAFSFTWHTRVLKGLSSQYPRPVVLYSRFPP